MKYTVIESFERAEGSYLCRDESGQDVVVVFGRLLDYLREGNVVMADDIQVLEVKAVNPQVLK